jgi:L-tartrate/succinate antiporter
VVWAGLASMAVPAGLKPAAWHYFALFAAVIVGLILEPIPAAAIGLAGIAVVGVSRLVDESAAASMTWALSGFQDRTV